jgi:hypothetical protein
MGEGGAPAILATAGLDGRQSPLRGGNRGSVSGEEVRPSVGSMRRSVVEVLVSLVAGTIMVLLVAGGGAAAERATESRLDGPASVNCLTDPLTICRSDEGRLICIREPT